MDLQVAYNIFHEIPLGVPIAIYFYLTGLSAGSFIISTLAYGFGIKKYKPAGRIGVVMATLLLLVAPLTLMYDLEQPLRAWHLFFYLNITSPITWGSFLLTLYPLNCVIYGYFMFKEDLKKTKFFGLLGIPLAILVHGYTGFILAFGKARALWNTALMPVLFLVSALVSGLALMILVTMIKTRFFSPEKKVDREIVSDLGKLLAWTIVIDLALVVSDLIVLMVSHTEAYKVAMLLLKGEFSPLFLGIEILVGAIVPLLILFYTHAFSRAKGIAGVAVASVLVLIGIFAMRVIVVVGGQFNPLS